MSPASDMEDAEGGEGGQEEEGEAQQVMGGRRQQVVRRLSAGRGDVRGAMGPEDTEDEDAEPTPMVCCVVVFCHEGPPAAPQGVPRQPSRDVPLLACASLWARARRGHALPCQPCRP